MTSSLWVSIKDRLPSMNQLVLSYHSKLGMVIDRYVGQPLDEITHWMPLPDPPKPEDPFTTWWDSLPKYKDINGREIPLRIIGEYVQDMKSARFIWDAAIASQKTDKQQP